jgi:4-hydroxy-tetrahydrodipicolinate synthase
MTVSPRFARCILATTVIPWTDRYTLDEGLYRDQIRRLLQAGFRHLYVFGTAGEGYAVDDQQFEQVARVFADEMRSGGAEPMLGLISLSQQTVLGRLAWARDTLGVKLFQVSLPSWGALEQPELLRFFNDVLGTFEDCEFLHYNLPRAKRLVTADEYATIAGRHPNLVATKNSTDSTQRIRDLMERAPMLQHFFNERGFLYGSLLGECGLLMSLASINFSQAQSYFRAGCSRDVDSLVPMEGELHAISREFAHAVGPAHIDGAFDKVLWWLHEPRFPLRLLPPYEGATDDAAREFLRWLGGEYPEWLPSERVASQG